MARKELTAALLLSLRAFPQDVSQRSKSEKLLALKRVSVCDLSSKGGVWAGLNQCRRGLPPHTAVPAVGRLGAGPGCAPHGQGPLLRAEEGREGMQWDLPLNPHFFLPGSGTGPMFDSNNIKQVLVPLFSAELHPQPLLCCRVWVRQPPCWSPH